MDKNFKIWGTVYGVIGDLIMSLPLLTYFEKKYPGSYKYFIIEQKVSQCAPLFFNHPLIDRIKITDKWAGFGDLDYEIANSCDYKCKMSNWANLKEDWYNYYSYIESVANIAGIYDMKEVLTEEEMIPKLYKWFPGNIKPVNAYNRAANEIHNNKVISICPKANYGKNTRQSMNDTWWITVVAYLINQGYEVWHFGMPSDTELYNHPNYKRYVNLSFMDQIRMILNSNIFIGTDNGVSWVIAAYDHPTICIATNWRLDHYKNKNSTIPVGNKVFTLNKLDIKHLIDKIEKEIL